MKNPDISSRSFWIIFVFLAIICLIPIWNVKYIPSQNGPLYILVTQIFSEYGNADFNFSENFQLVFILIPNLLFHFLVYLFTFILPILSSYKIVLSIAMLLLPIGMYYLVNAVDAKRVLWGLIIFIYIYNYYLFKGYDSFYLSFSIFLFYIGYLIKNSAQLNIKNYLILSLLSIVIYFTHIFTFIIVMMVTFVYVLLLYRNFTKLVKVMLIFLPSLLAFLQYVLYLFSHSDPTKSGNVIRYTPPQETIHEFFHLTMYSYSELTVLFFLVPFVFILYSVVKYLIEIYRTYFFQKKISINLITGFMKNEIILLIVILLTFLFFIAPREVIGWPKFNTRFIPFILFFVIVMAKVPANSSFRKLFLISTVIMSIITFIFMGYQLVNINKVYDDYTSGISVIKKNKTLLPVHIEDYVVGKIKPLNWAFSYYNVFKGGTTNKVLAYAPGRAPLTYKYDVKNVFPDFDPDYPEKSDYTKISKVYNYILFWGFDNDKFQLFENVGYKLIHQKGKLNLFAKGND